MKPLLLTAAVVALVTVAACNSAEQNVATAPPSDGNVADPAPANSAAAPQDTITAAQAYDIRHERFEEMGDSFKAINRELKGGSPDVARVQREAASLAGLAAQIPSWFPAGSGPDVHTKSRAKASIWSNPEGFRRAHEGYLAQARNFNQVAQAGEIEAIRAAAQTMGRACGTCHDDYRGPER